MQELMTFSTDFAERLKEEYPAFFPLYSSLTESERGFIKLIQERDFDKYDINQRLETNAYEIEYDPETSILTVWELEAHADFDPDGLVCGGFDRGKRSEMTVEEFKEMYAGFAGGMFHAHFFNELDQYIEIEKQVSKVKSSFTEERVSELQALESKYDQLDRLHRIMARKQENLKNILNDLIQGKDFDDIYGLQHYIEIYNKLSIGRVSSRGGVLIENPPIEEKNYLEFSHNWSELVDRDFAYCLVGFLMPVGSRNYIYKCDNCKYFYLPKKIYTSDSGLRFCSNPCRMKHHHSKPEYREKKAAAQRERYGWDKSVNAK
jgi:hypothetical protein